MTTTEFISRLTPENTELIQKLQAVKTPEDGYEIAVADGLTDDYDAFVDTMTKYYESVRDLSEDDLDMVAGGVDASDVVTAVVSISVSGAVTSSVSAVSAVSAATASAVTAVSAVVASIFV